MIEEVHPIIKGPGEEDQTEDRGELLAVDTRGTVVQVPVVVIREDRERVVVTQVDIDPPDRVEARVPVQAEQDNQLIYRKNP